jgi:hypothetical protein
MALVSEESRVLLIYTGGTIGMLVSDTGYVPEPFFLFETLRSQTSRFHDPLGDSLLSKSRSVEEFRKWSQSQSASRDQSKSRGTSPQRTVTAIGEGITGIGRKKDILDSRLKGVLSMSTLAEAEDQNRQLDGDRAPADERQDPRYSATSPEPTGTPLDPTGPSTLPVRSTRPIKPPPLTSILLANMDESPGRGRLDKLKIRCVKIRENCYEMHLPSLVTPTANSAPGGNVKRIRYAVLEVCEAWIIETVLIILFSGIPCWIAPIWKLQIGYESLKK